VRLGLKTVAEGVETAEEAKLLNLLGIDYLQGFYFAKPMPEEEVLSLLSWSVMVLLLMVMSPIIPSLECHIFGLFL
jgi:c-di-GMP-related signal transduction protein